MLRKGYSVPRDFSWIENYELYYLAGIEWATDDHT